MEEQTVPSAGFSPQHEYMDCGTGYYGMPPQQPFYNNQQHPQQHQHQVLHKANSGSGQMEYMADYFDLSLLGDAYEDKDMATVPSPSSWPHLGIMEPAQQMSFYASSPADYRAFSPDCSPVKPVACENGGGGSGPNTPSPPPPQPAQAAALNYPVGSPAGQLTEDCRNNILLRQCLEDNTFLEKYNIKPLDLPMHEDGNMENGVPTVATSAVGSTTLEYNSIEPVFTLAYEQIISDIQTTCRTLAISPDPMSWSCADVQSWLCYSLVPFSSERGTSAAASDVNPTNSSAAATTATIRSLWSIDGQRLCSLSEDEFHRRDPVNGARIFANLELLKIWKCSGDSVISTPASMASVETSGHQGAAASGSFDLGQILLASATADAGSYSCSASPASSVESQSPAPIEIKLEVDETMQPAGNPASVDNTSSSSSSSSASSSPSMRHSDDDDDDEEEEEKPVSASTAPNNGGKAKACGTKNGAHIHLWQFLKELLASGQQHGSCIRWLDQSRGVFKIEDSVRVARLWGIRKNRPAMNYDKLSRSIRQYYRKGIMRKTERSQRLVYQFCHPYGL